MPRRSLRWLAPELKPTAGYRAAHLRRLARRARSRSPKKRHVLDPPDRARWNPRRFPIPLPCSLLPAPSFSPTALLRAWFARALPGCVYLAPSGGDQQPGQRLGAHPGLDRNLVLDEFKSRCTWTVGASRPTFPDALGLPPNAEVANSDAYRRGFVEIQDLGSQLVLATAPVVPGTRWLDACAGAGGKSLQLARMVGDAGHVERHTTSARKSWRNCAIRAKRARLDNVRITKNLRRPTTACWSMLRAPARRARGGASRT